LSGYKLVKSIPTPNCSVCTGSNNKSKVETQADGKMRIK